MAIITAIDKGSIGEELGLEVGDELLGFNGEKIIDVLDYVYYDSQDSFVLNIKAKQGDVVDIEIERTKTKPWDSRLTKARNWSLCAAKTNVCFVS